jgi:large subunit ribosomal protein L23
MGILEVFKKKPANTISSTKKSITKPKKEIKKDLTSSVIKNEQIVKKDKPAKKENVVKLSKGDAHKILIKPLITEKSSDMSALNQYTFEASVRTNKTEIKKAVYSLYDVNPIGIRILNKPGKLVRRGRSAGVTKKWKKAIVTLKPGDKIEFFTGV